MKPQDIVILLKLLIWGSRKWRYSDIADALCVSPSEVHKAVARCTRAGMYNAYSGRPIRSALLEFIIHGVKYSFPVQPGPVARGMPTAYSLAPLSEVVLAQAGDQVVWPVSDGAVVGRSVQPLYPTLPPAAAKDPVLYRWLGLIDALRIGRTREQRLAAETLSSELCPQ